MVGPGTHQKFLVTRDGFLLDFSRHELIRHELCHLHPNIKLLKVSFAVCVVFRKLAYVEAGNGLDCVVLRGETVFYKLFDQFQVVCVVKLVGVLLPELLRVTRSPSELLSINLFLEFIDRAVDLLVLLEIGEEVLQHLVNVLIDPVSVLQFDDQVQGVDLGQVVLTVWDVLQVVKEHEHDAGNLLLAVVVHDLRDLLDDRECVVLEVLISELVVAQNPEHAQHVVGNLIRLKTLPVEQVRYQFETLPRRILLRYVILLQDGH